jgi:hypothetical protein
VKLLALLLLATAIEAPPFTIPGDVAAEAPSRVDQLLALALSPQGAVALAGLLGGLGGLVGTSVVRRRRIAKAVNVAFFAVEALSKETDSPLDDKAAEGLRRLNEYLLKNGWREATEGETAIAHEGFAQLARETKEPKP